MWKYTVVCIKHCVMHMKTNFEIFVLLPEYSFYLFLKQSENFIFCEENYLGNSTAEIKFYSFFVSRHSNIY